jgi:hypothetical protein
VAEGGVGFAAARASGVLGGFAGGVGLAAARASGVLGGFAGGVGLAAARASGVLGGFAGGVGVGVAGGAPGRGGFVGAVVAGFVGAACAGVTGAGRSGASRSSGGDAVARVDRVGAVGEMDAWRPSGCVAAVGVARGALCASRSEAGGASVTRTGVAWPGVPRASRNGSA